MKRFLVIVAILFASIGYCQQNNDTGQIDLEKLKRQIDSSNKMMETLGTSRYKKMQEQEIKSMTENSANYFAAMQRERKAREKKAMYRNLALGTLFLAVLIFGLLRKRKKPDR